MVRRGLLVVLIVALGGLGAVWFAAGTFTITRTVTVEPPTALGVGPGRPSETEMRIRCGPTSSYYVTDGGDLMFFNGATGGPETPGPLCDEARSQRRQGAVAFVLAGLLGGLVVIAWGRGRDRRTAEPQPEVSAPAGLGPQL